MKRRYRKYTLLLAVVLASTTPAWLTSGQIYDSLLTAKIVAAEQPVAGQDPVPESARTWGDRVEDIEAFLRSAEVEKVEDIGDGVTKPEKATLTPGGPADAFA